MTVVRTEHARSAATVLQQASGQFSNAPSTDINMLNVLAMKLNVYSWLPNALFQPVLDWLMENIGPLQEMLDDLSGYPDQITEHAEQSKGAAQIVETQATPLFQQGVDTALQSWTGDSAQNFAALAEAITDVLVSYPRVARRIAEMELFVGAETGRVRAFVRDTISDMFVEIVREAGRLGLAGLVGGRADRARNRPRHPLRPGGSALVRPPPGPPVRRRMRARLGRPDARQRRTALSPDST